MKAKKILGIILNVLLIILCLWLIVSGVLISKTVLPNLTTNNRMIQSLHLFAGAISIILLGIRLGLLFSKKKMNTILAIVITVVAFAAGIYGFIASPIARWLAAPFTIASAPQRDGLPENFDGSNFPGGNFNPEDFNNGNFPDGFNGDNFNPGNFNPGNFNPGSNNGDNSGNGSASAGSNMSYTNAPSVPAGGSFTPGDFNGGNFKPEDFNGENFTPGNFDGSQFDMSQIPSQATSSKLSVMDIILTVVSLIGVSLSFAMITYWLNILASGDSKEE